MTWTFRSAKLHRKSKWKQRGNSSKFGLRRIDVISTSNQRVPVGFRFVLIRHICKVYIIDTCAAKTHSHSQTIATPRPNACILLFAFFKIHKVIGKLNWLFSTFTFCQILLFVCLVLVLLDLYKWQVNVTQLFLLSVDFWIFLIL